MKKVDLDKTFEVWKNKNEEHLKEKFLDTHNFENYLEEAWREYQRENDLIDVSNEIEEESEAGVLNKIQQKKDKGLPLTNIEQEIISTPCW